MGTCKVVKIDEDVSSVSSGQRRVRQTKDSGRIEAAKDGTSGMGVVLCYTSRPNGLTLPEKVWPANQFSFPCLVFSSGSVTRSILTFSLPTPLFSFCSPLPPLSLRADLGGASPHP